MAQAHHDLFDGHTDPRWPGIVVRRLGERFVLGYTIGCYGVWLLRADQLELIEQWPRTESGRVDSSTRFEELESRPPKPPQSFEPTGTSTRQVGLVGALIVVGIALGIASLFPAYLSGVALSAQSDQLVEHVLFLAGWAVTLAMVVAGKGTLRPGAAFGVGLSVVAFGFYLSDLGAVIAFGAHVGGTGLWLGLLGWCFATAGCTALVVSLLRSRTMGRPTRRVPAFGALVGGLSVGLAITFAPSWDSFRLSAAATGQVSTATAGNAFANPAAVIAGSVVTMIAIVLLATLAATWRPLQRGAFLLAGALVPMIAEFVSALVQAATPPASTTFGISAADAAQLRLQISTGFTPDFYLYLLFLAALVLICLAWMGSARIDVRDEMRGLFVVDGGPGIDHRVAAGSEDQTDGRSSMDLDVATDFTAPSGSRERDAFQLGEQGAGVPAVARANDIAPEGRRDGGPPGVRPGARAASVRRVAALLVIAVVVMVVGNFAWSGSTRTYGPTTAPPASTTPAPGQGSSATGAPVDAASLAKGVDPVLVDIDSTLAYEGAQALGTGIVLSSTGEVLTNNHVIEGGTSITVRDVGNGKTYSASVVGYDRSKDLAVVQLKGASGLKVASIATSGAVKAGDGVVAVGNAEGAGGTPSYAAGSVLATDQSITAMDEATGGSEQLSGLIETNAAIISGDSGGALVNSAGKVIAMVTAGSTSFRFQSSATEGFAIPIGEANSVAAQITANRASSTVHIGATAFLGVDLETPPTGSGAEIVQVLSGTPAAAAGLSVGDTITAIDAKTVSSPEALTDILLDERPGSAVQLGYLDPSGLSHTVTVTLGSGPPQ